MAWSALWNETSRPSSPSQVPMSAASGPRRAGSGAGLASVGHALLGGQPRRPERAPQLDAARRRVDVLASGAGGPAEAPGEASRVEPEPARRHQALVVHRLRGQLVQLAAVVPEHPVLLPLRHVRRLL